MGGLGSIFGLLTQGIIAIGEGIGGAIGGGIHKAVEKLAQPIKQEDPEDSCEMSEDAMSCSGCSDREQNSDGFNNLMVSFQANNRF